MSTCGKYAKLIKTKVLINVKLILIVSLINHFSFMLLKLLIGKLVVMIFSKLAKCNIYFK